MGTRSILVIDDEAGWLKFTRRLLTGCGWKVHTALTCAEGIHLAAQLKPDCILLDFHLQDGDAVSVCAALKASVITNGIPIIIISGDSAAEFAAYAECRAAAFLEKGARCVQAIPALIERVLLDKSRSAALRP